MGVWEETTGMWLPDPEAVAPSEMLRKTFSRNSLLAEISALEADALPPSTEEALAELGRCLRLTAPSGMSQDERKEWLRIALLEVQDMTSAEFFPACAHARKIADHPAKIIPAICAYKPPSFNNAAEAQHRLRNARKRLENFDAQLLTGPSEPEICTPEQAAEILAENDMESAFAAPNLNAWRRGRELRMPTEEELAELARTTPP